MTFIGTLTFLIGCGFLFLFREIERGAGWLEEMVGVRRFVSLQIQSDTVLKVGVTFASFGLITFVIAQTRQAVQ